MRLFKPTTETGIAGLMAIGREPQGALLAFDFDGVIAPTTSDPVDSQPLPGIVPILTQLTMLVRSVAIISGRTAADVLGRTGIEGIASHAGFAIFGVYGIQRWDTASKQVVSQPISSRMAAVNQELPPLLVRELGTLDRVQINNKEVSIAIHARQPETAAKTLKALRYPLTRLAVQYGLSLEVSQAALELLPSGIDKGTSLRAYAHDCRATAVLYIGDDATDIPAYRAVDELVGEGLAGVKILSGSSANVSELAKFVDLILDGPGGVLQFVRALARTLSKVDERSAIWVEKCD